MRVRTGGEAIEFERRPRHFTGVLCTVLLASTLVGIGVAASPAAAADPVGTVTNIPTTNIISPFDITTGPDGNVWFVNFATDAIGRLTPAGELSEFRDAVSLPQGITTGPDGALWAVGRGEIGRITTAGEVTKFPTRSQCCSASIVTGSDGALWFTSEPQSISRITTDGEVSSFFTFRETRGIAAGPDGALWFTTNFGNAVVGRITTAGVITNFTDPAITSPGTLTTGPDGNLWFTQSGSIGRITPTGVVTTFPAPSVTGFEEITAGPDGALWFANGSNGIGRITVSGAITNFTDSRISSPRGITSGPGGALWFTNTGNNSIGRMTTAGTVTATFEGDGFAEPAGIAAGANGDLWITDPGTSSIARMTPSGDFTLNELPSLEGFSASPRDIIARDDGRLFFIQQGSGVSVSELFLFGNAGVGTITPQGQIITDTSNTAPPNDIAVRGGSPVATTSGGCVQTGPPPFPGFPPAFECFPAGMTGHPSVAYPDSRIVNPGSIAAGRDGTTWFRDVDGIGMIVGAQLTKFDDPDVLDADALAVGADGNLWFKNNSQPTSIGRITPQGVVTMFSHPSISAPGELALGPDDNIWFTNTGNNSIGRITPSGHVTNYTGDGISEPTAITAGRDGGVWFINSGNDSFGRVQALLPNAATMAYPANGAFVGTGTFLVAAGGPGVNAIEFRAIGGALHDTVVASAANYGPYGWWGIWNTAALPAGNYQIVAVGTDADGNRGRSSPRTITIDHTPPTTLIGDPPANAVLHGTVPLVAGATDNHAVAKVEFLRNSTVIATAARTWFGWLGIWDTTTVANGTYNLRSRAYDAAGNTKLSTPVTIRVQN